MCRISITHRNNNMVVRVPTQIVFSNSLCFPCVFPVQLLIFPVTIYLICDYYIHKTDLVDLSSFWEKKGIFLQQISQYPLLLESEHSQLEQAKFPVISLCFDKILKFPVFSLCFDKIPGVFPVF